MAALRGPLASPLVLVALLAPFTAGLLLLDAAAAQRVDCRKFVFAPSCRGVAAKRSSEVVRRDDKRGERPLRELLVFSPDYPGSEGPSDPTGVIPRPQVEEEGVLQRVGAGGTTGEEEEEDVEEEGVEDDEESDQTTGTGARGSGTEGRGWVPPPVSTTGGRSDKDDWSRRHEKLRKSEPLKMSSQHHRKVAKTPAAYEWLSSNDRRRRRDKGARRRSEYTHYDY